MHAPPPRFVVLGGPVPEKLQQDLRDCIELVPEGALADEKVEGALVHARADVLATVSRFRRNGTTFPLYALAAGPVDVASRIQWIRYGVDDLLDPDNASITLRRRLDADGGQRTDVRDEAFRRAFVQRWVTAMHRYVSSRNEIVARLGEGGLARYLDAARLRDFCAKASDPNGPVADSFGERRGADREPLHWPVKVIEPEVADGALMNVGADGVALSCDRPPADRLRVEIRTGSFEATLDLEIRWQRRVGRQRWEAGAIVNGVTLTREG